MKRLTDRQQQALDFIRFYTASNGFPPSVRDIADHMGIRSTNGVMDHLNALVRKGRITRSEKLSRSIRLVGGSPPLAAAAPTSALAQALRRALAAYTILAADGSGKLEPDLGGALAHDLAKHGVWWPNPHDEGQSVSEDERQSA
jgi:repressor LexA